jgi:hypothetical protein
MAMNHCIEYDGPPEGYISFLEATVLQLKDEVRKLEQQQQRTELAKRQPSQPANLVFRFESPASLAAKSSASSNPLPRSLWLFLKKLPRTQESWAVTRKRTGFETTADYLHTLELLTRYAPQYYSRSANIGPGSTAIAATIDILQDFKTFTVNLLSFKNYAVQVSNCTVLLFFVISLVAIADGVPRKLVNQLSLEVLTKIQGKSTATTKYLGELRSCAKWVVQQQIKLLGCTGDSSWEIFVHGMLQ